MKAIEFLKENVKRSNFGDPHGLNKLPFVLFNKISELMESYFRLQSKLCDSPFICSIYDNFISICDENDINYIIKYNIESLQYDLYQDFNVAGNKLLSSSANLEDLVNCILKDNGIEVAY